MGFSECYNVNLQELGGSMASSSSSSSAASSYSNSPCAACKFLRRKCLPGCIFAPYFPPEEPQKFANVHKIFGASNVSKLLNEIQPHQREDAVNSLAYEAEARLKDPVYGCVGAISVLQRQVLRLQKELDATNADLMRYASNHESYPPPPPPPPNISVNQILINQQQRTTTTNSQYGRLIGHHQNYNHHHHPPFPSYTSSSWNNNINSFSGDDPVDN